MIDEIKPAQISLISSAGMTIMDANLILADKGVVYHQDGLYNRTSAAKVRSFKPTQTLNEHKGSGRSSREGYSEYVSRLG